ncbi:MAG TPA: TonB family protein [Rhizomicrobium sp.]|nr:TonB family protein [Rhizomicrobium sp.]
MRKFMQLTALLSLAAGLLLSLRAAADPSATPSSTSDPQPIAVADQVPRDQFGRPLACDRFLPAGAFRPADDRGTLVSVRVTADGNLRDATLFRSSGDEVLDRAAVACAPAFRLHVAQNGKPAEVTWIVGVYWHASWSTFRVPMQMDWDQCRSSAHVVAVARRYPNAKLSYRVDANGTVSSVSLDASSGNDALDRMAIACASTWVYFPAEQSGHAVAVEWHADFPRDIGEAP